MNILLATLVFPYPINDGGKSGTFRMINSLRKKNNITLITRESNDYHLAELQKIWPDVKIIPFKNNPPVPKDGWLKSFIKGLLGKKIPATQASLQQSQMQLKCYTLLEYYFEDLLEVFIREINSRPFDLVQIDFMDLSPLVHFVPKHIPKIFVQHEHKFYRMIFERNTLENPTLGDDWKINNTRIFEIGTLNLYDRIVCLSEFDKQLLVEDGIPASKVDVSPLPMQLVEHNINKPFTSANRLLFLGPDQHYPNIDGIDWFLKNCWESLRKLNPGLKLLIVGRWSEEKIKWFKDYPDVEFKGFVSDLSTIMEGSVMIVPLRIGGGMRMKILEGVSYHTPIVSTSIGAEGIPLKHDESCKIADTAEDFIVHTHELLNSPEQQQAFIRNAVQVLSKGFTPEECGKIREEVFRKALESK